MSDADLLINWWNAFQYYPSIYSCLYQEVSFIQAFPPNPCIHRFWNAVVFLIYTTSSTSYMNICQRYAVKFIRRMYSKPCYYILSSVLTQRQCSVRPNSEESLPFCLWTGFSQVHWHMASRIFYCRNFLRIYDGSISSQMNFKMQRSDECCYMARKPKNLKQTDFNQLFLSYCVL